MLRRLFSSATLMSQIDIETASTDETTESLSKANFSSIEASTFVPLDRSAPNIVSDISMKVVERKLKFAGLRLVQLDSQAESNKPRTVISYGNQDSLDILQYVKDESASKIENQYKILITEVPRQAVKFRETLTGEEQPATVMGLPGAYARLGQGDSGLKEVIRVACERKTGISPSSSTEYLSGNGFPTIGYLTEGTFLRAVQGEYPEYDKPAVSFHSSPFQQNIIRHLLTPQEAFDKFISGEIQDARAVKAIIRFCEREEIPLDTSKLPSIEAEPQAVCKEIQSLVRTKTEIENLSYLETDRNALSNQKSTLPITGSETNFGKIVSISCQNLNATGKAISKEYIAEVTVPRYPDATDALLWYRNKDDGEIYVELNRSEKEVVSAREEEAHVIQTDSNSTQITLTSAWHKKTKLSPEERASNAREIAIKKGGLKPLKEPVYIASYFPSPGSTIERDDLYLVQIDVGKEPSETPNEKIILKLDDALELCYQGDIQSPRLEAALLILRESQGSREGPMNSFDASQKELDEILAIIDNGTELHRWLKEVSPELHEDLSQHLIYRKLISIAANELGVIPFESEHPEERSIFRDFLTTIAVHRLEDQRRWPLRVFHDVVHYQLGAFSSFLHNEDGTVMRTDEGDPIRRTLSQFQHICGEPESIAAAQSDVNLPTLYGLDSGDILGWRRDTGQLFHSMGFDYEKALKFVTTIELEGIIPEEILRHEDYDIHRDSVLRFLRYAAMDREQLRIIYDDLEGKPELAEVIVSFFNVFHDVQRYQEYYRGQFENLEKYSEGVNPYRAYVAATIFKEIKVQAYQLGYLREKLRSHGAHSSEDEIERIGTYLELLHEALDTLSDHHKSIRTFDPSEEIVAAHKKIKKYQENLFKEVKWYIDKVSENTFLIGDEGVEEIRGRKFPGLSSQEITNHAAIEREVAYGERRSFERYGMSYKARH